MNVDYSIFGRPSYWVTLYSMGVSQDNNFIMHKLCNVPQLLKNDYSFYNHNFKPRV